MKKIVMFSVAMIMLASCGNQTAQKTNNPSTVDKGAQITEVITQEVQSTLTPDAVLESLKAGNARYVENRQMPRDLKSQAVASLQGQFPEAIVLSCIDSRVPVEYIFDKGIGDLFVGRVAGNVADDYMLGSLEYACEVSGSKVLLVLGHHDCGAIKSAIKGVELGNITSLMEEIKPSVEATQYEGERTYGNKEFADAVVVENVIQTMNEIRRDSPILKKLEDEGKIKICGAVYEMTTGKVHFL
ncbi:carbonic anhydrase family protein [Porphyromonas sp.]|uniref:carbonic anhydrase family protein n=1 Tax=Porphyromonas sp. TaxID=1924944 RepID=UPI0026DD08CD|nr:carbonic anhydrase family protein [Porphyromonas sp.]MDO4695522.1 carbonic anhydrase family protein [Porphyromonas sp.]MDO4771678.1 carbonic anhydrase family protein [Porphyromonas sp.]